MRKTIHKQVLVQVDDMKAEIDAGIAPLIRELWKAGIRTFNSCQENKPGIIWIEIATVDDGIAFLNIVAHYEEEEEEHSFLYNRICHGWDIDDETSLPFWDYAVFPRDLGLYPILDDDDTVFEIHDGRTDFNMSLSIRFPTADYPVLLQRMTEHNAQNSQDSIDKLNA